MLLTTAPDSEQYRAVSCVCTFRYKVSVLFSPVVEGFNLSVLDHLLQGRGDARRFRTSHVVLGSETVTSPEAIQLTPNACTKALLESTVLRAYSPG